jgi:D-proline reductase (dithiol) PrdB
MAELSDLPLSHRVFLAAYRFRALDPVPFAPPRKPLAELKIALVTSGGLVPPGEAPFDLAFRGGDPSFRVIAKDADVASLAIHQRSEDFDHTGFEADRNVGFPLDRLREMEGAGEFVLAPRHLSFMGSITAPGRLTKETAPAAADLFVADGVEAALLVPL